MRLVKAGMSGFGRLALGRVNLDNKVIAIVGPNEAGKTTLLKALAYIYNGKSLSIPERSRGMNIADNHVVVKVQYLLSKDDQAAVQDLNIEEPPRSIWLSRTAAEGDVSIAIEPTPEKAIAPLEVRLKALFKSTTKKAFSARDSKPPEDDKEEIDADRFGFRTRVEDALDQLKNAVAEKGARAAAAERSSEITALVERFGAYGLEGPIQEAVESVNEWITRAEPLPEVARRLYDRVPEILLFDDEDRTLASTYTLAEDVVAGPPRALRNLMSMAELSLPALWQSINNGDEGERESLVYRANETLATKFAAAWKQSDVTVHLKIEGTLLAVRIKQDGNRITQFDERSEGLRMFVALVAFLAVRGTTIPPILLIDEAETHLHIDAQADLVNTFMTQQQAAKIIYTTHSPACLPPDLGSNIRAVLPDKEHESRSTIEGSFWRGAAGYSPLMLAMGAGAAAFSATRFVVLAEGASEMLLLPSLIKAAVDLPDLEYQIAPGLSEASTSLYSELDLEGSRVAYLVDGDNGGLKRRKALVDGGVPEWRIVTLNALTLENLLDAGSYLSAVRLLLPECNPGIKIPDLPKLPDPASVPWPGVLDTWANGQGIAMPGKRVVASRLVEESLARPSDLGAKALRVLHKSLEAILKVKSQ